MYALTPLKVYVLERAANDPLCAARMERMLTGLGNAPEVVTVTDANLGEVVEELRHLWPPDQVPDGWQRTWMRPLVFTTIELRHQRPDLSPLLARCPEGTTVGELQRLHGFMTTAIDQHPHQRDWIENCVCWPTYNFGTVLGCNHGCLYCGEGRAGRYLAVALNLEEYMQKIVGPVIEYNPWSKVFRMILNGADLITLEPEYGLFDLFSRKLAEFDGRYGHFHTGSANVEWLADLEHKDKLVGVWSTTCETVARDLEPGSGPAIERINAARKVQDMGLSVRFKFKPVIPVKNWREEYAWILEQAVTRVHPETIGFSLYIWNSYESMSNTLPLDLLDPECVEAAREAADKMRGVRTGPFPHETRREVYRHLIDSVRRHDPDMPMYVCTESREMWDDLADELGQDPRTYHCGCGSIALPNRKLGISPGLRYSTYHPTPV